jgi:hypothetical protein
MSENKRAVPNPAHSPAPKAPKDIAILSGPTEDGQGARVVRIREGGDITAGEIRPVREGEPLNHSELVRLRPLDASQRVCEIEVLHAPQPDPRTAGGGAGAGRRGDTSASSGPARVSNAKYRNNWSAIFESQLEARDPQAHADAADDTLATDSTDLKHDKSGWSIN